MHEAFAVQVAHTARYVGGQAHAHRPAKFPSLIGEYRFQAAAIDELQANTVPLQAFVTSSPNAFTVWRRTASDIATIFGSGISSGNQ